MGWRFLKEKASFMAIIIVMSLFSIYLINPVSAQEETPQENLACCERTVSGEACMRTQTSNCDVNYKVGEFQTCEDSTFCKPGCCISPNGDCSKQVAKGTCDALEGYTFDADALCNIPKCNKGCCVLGGSSCLYSTEKKCGSVLQQYPELVKDYRPIGSEQECTNVCRAVDKGCCVKDDGTCKFEARGTCTLPDGTGSTGFYNEVFCANAALEQSCECTPHAYKSCVEGSEDVYWFDSCGNQEDVAADCDYGQGDLCSAPDVNNDGAYCKSVNCDINALTDYENIDYDVERTRKNGESWCIYDAAVGPAKDLPGSRHFRNLCLNGEEIIDPCKDFREEVCKYMTVTNVGDMGDYTEGSCLPNNVKECSTLCNTAKDAESKEEKKIKLKADEQCCKNPTRGCGWSWGDEKGIESDKPEGFCYPIVPPGGKFWSDDTSQAQETTELSQTCNVANTECTATWESNVNTGFEWECTKNCHCYNKDYLSYIHTKCSSLGDCGAKYNYIGTYTNDGFFRSWNGDWKGWDGKDAEESKKPLEYWSDDGTYEPNPGNGLFLGNYDYKTYQGSISEQLTKPRATSGEFSTGELVWAGTAGLGAGVGIAAIGVAAGIGHFAQIGGSAAQVAAAASAAANAASAANAAASAVAASAGAAATAESIAAASTALQAYDAASKVASTAATAATATTTSLGTLQAIASVAGLAAVAVSITVAIIAMANGDYRSGALILGTAAAGVAVSSLLGIATPALTSLTALGPYGALVALVIAATLITLSVIGDDEKRTVTMSCQPWQPPLAGDDCAICDEGNKPCSEYRCRSLGATCKFIKENEGTRKGTCYNADPNDVNRPVISRWDETFNVISKRQDITSQFSIESFQEGGLEGGYEIVGEIPSFSRINFGIQTNENSQCRMGTELKTTYNELTMPFPDSYFTFTHNISIGPLLPDKTYEYYVICRDPSGNPKEDGKTAPFKIRFKTDNGPDLEPPLIIATSVPNNGKIKADANNLYLGLYVDEVSQFSCNFSSQDKDYSFMESGTVCAAAPAESILSSYALCVANLTIVGEEPNVFYFRCADRPVNSQGQAQEPNINGGSYIYTVTRSKPLKITQASPQGQTLYSKEATMQVKTAEGSENGLATCYYEGSGYTAEFFITNQTNGIHEQKFLGLPKGFYNFAVTCYDSVRNEAMDNINFTIDVDESAPVITGLYASGSSTIISFNEPATCEYKNETFIFGQGIKAGTLQLQQTLSGLQSYHVICEDSFNNRILETVIIPPGQAKAA